jgi:hypothetical protein
MYAQRRESPSSSDLGTQGSSLFAMAIFVQTFQQASEVKNTPLWAA